MGFKDFLHKTNSSLSNFLHKAGGTASSIFHKIGSGLETISPIVSSIVSNPAVQAGVAGLATAVGGPEAGLGATQFLSTLGNLANKGQQVGNFSKNLGDFTNPSNYTGDIGSNATNALEKAKKLNTQRQMIFM